MTFYGDHTVEPSTGTVGGTFTKIYNSSYPHTIFQDYSTHEWQIIVDGVFANFGQDNYNEATQGATTINGGTLCWRYTCGIGGGGAGGSSQLPKTTLYYNAAVDKNWNNHLNWWTDVNFTNQSPRIPITGDVVYVE
jgi:hypothetical protein